MPLGTSSLSVHRRADVSLTAAALFCVLQGLLGLTSGPASAQATPHPANSGVPLASAAIDHTLYREGEVRRLTGTFAAWTLVCDEVTRLKRRFCSLRTLVRDAAGATVAALTISTGDDGRPAALMRIPAGSVSNTIVEIVVTPKPAGPVDAKASKAAAASNPTPTTSPLSAAPPPSPPAKAAVGIKLRPATCDSQTCTVVWSLPSAHIKALNSGGGLQVRYPRAIEPRDFAALSASDLSLKAPTRPLVLGSVDASGFAAAVDASINYGR